MEELAKQTEGPSLMELSVERREEDKAGTGTEREVQV